MMATALLLRTFQVPSRFVRPHGTQFRFFSFSFPGPRSLEDIVKLPLLSKETPEKIESIWREFHNERKDTIAVSMAAENFQKLLSRGNECPYFVHPIWREQGYFMLLSQFQDRHVLVTYLEDFKSNPNGAQPWLVISAYSDLVESKGLGLVRGDITPNLSSLEASDLFTKILESYTEDTRYEEVECFNNTPQSFDLEKYVEELSKEEMEKKP